MNKNMTKSWRRSRTGKIWSIYHLKMSNITKEEIGKKIVCGMCGKKAKRGYHLTTNNDSLRLHGTTIPPITQPDWQSFNPVTALSSLSVHTMDELDDDLDLILTDAVADVHELDFGHWFVNDCCRAKFQQDCFELGFKIDRGELSSTSRRSLNQHGLYREKRRR